MQNKIFRSYMLIALMLFNTINCVQAGKYEDLFLEAVKDTKGALRHSPIPTPSVMSAPINPYRGTRTVTRGHDVMTVGGGWKKVYETSTYHTSTYGVSRMIPEAAECMFCKARLPDSSKVIVTLDGSKYLMQSDPGKIYCAQRAHGVQRAYQRVQADQSLLTVLSRIHSKMEQRVDFLGRKVSFTPEEYALVDDSENIILCYGDLLKIKSSRWKDWATLVDSVQNAEQRLKTNGQQFDPILLYWACARALDMIEEATSSDSLLGNTILPERDIYPKLMMKNNKKKKEKKKCCAVM